MSNAQIIDPASVQIGTILYSSWGYEQTNVSFYQVVRKSGKTLFLRKIHNQLVEGGDASLSGRVVPRVDNFKSEEIRKIVRQPKYSITHDSEYIQIWNGLPQYCSWYH